MSVRDGVVEDAISFRNLGEIWYRPQALCGFWPKISFYSICLNVISCRVSMVDTEVLSSLVEAPTNCSFKISTWSVGSE